jgi:hypothetical protein
MRILYVGDSGGLKNAALFYLFPPRLINGMIREGHTVHVFNDKDMARGFNIFHSSRMGLRKTNLALLQTCRDFMPELIILAHCKNILNETLMDIRDICPHVKIIHRNVDPLSDAGNVARILDRVNYVDGIFITTAGPSLQKFTSAKTFCSFIPNPVDPSIDTAAAFSAPTYDADLFFAAGAMKHDDHRTELVSKLMAHATEVKTEIIGAGINDRSLFGLPYIEKLARVKMGLVINKTEDFYLYASDRMSQYMGNGIMVFAHSLPSYTDIFSNGEIITYSNTDELIDRVRYYAAHDTERRQIAEKGYVRAHQVFNSQLVARHMIDTTFDLSPSSYAWPSTKYTG